MSTQRAVVRPTVDPIPNELASPRAKLVYLYLDTAEQATVDDMQRSLHVPKLALLSVLRSLSDDGLVECDGGQYATA